MFKKLLITTAVLAATSTVAFANGAPYVGASLGANSGKAIVKQTETQGTLKSNIGTQNALVNIFAGYGAVVNQKTYLAGELFANTNFTNSSNQTSFSGSGVNQYIKLNSTYSYGVSFIPGLMLTDRTMFYGRVGVVKTNFNYKSTVQNNTNQPFSKSKMATGGQLGLGLQTNLAPHVDLRGEYVYTAYRSFNLAGDNIAPRNSQANLGVVYKFD